MTVDFTNLETLAQAELDWTLSEIFATQASQYQNATAEEILNLLAEVAETYAILAPTLPQNLEYSARKEIEFFLSLYQDKRNRLSYFQKPQHSPESVRSLSYCAGGILDELLTLKKGHYLPTFKIARAT